VSTATVSRALRGLDRVSPETRQRVLDAAEQLHYVASPTATSLASGRTRFVAVVAAFLHKWYFGTLLGAVEQTLNDRGHHVLIVNLENDSVENRTRISHDMLWKRVDGVISLNIPMGSEEVSLVEGLDLPLVTVGMPVAGHGCVRIDDAGTVHVATRHLLDLGHTRIGYVGDVRPHAPHAHTAIARLGAFRSTMAGAGLDVPDRWLLDSDWTAGSAARGSIAMLSSDDRPTAVVAASDEMAIGVRETARRLGLDVPAELSVVGVDDFELSEVLGLTTVRQDVPALGRVSAGLLLSALLDGYDLRDEVVMPTELVVRRSTAPPAARPSRARR
jgi:DNA-binding LacI/PurR family transcriptional regulator